MDLVDVHSHVMPRGLVERYGSASEIGAGRYSVELWGIRVSGVPRGIFDLGARVRDMDSEDVAVQVLLPMVDPRAMSPKAARLVNDELRAEAVPHGERFVRFAVLPYGDPSAALGELDRAYRDLGVGGVLLWSDMAGMSPGSDALDAIYGRLEDYGIPAFVHPSLPADPRLSSHYMGVVAGAIGEDFVAVASVILGGVLDRFPRLRLIFPHGGGAAPVQVGRIRRAAEVRSDCALRRDPLDYMRSMYFDSAVYSPEALRFLVQVVGIDRVLLGTDYPADIMEWRGMGGRVEEALGRAGLEAIGRRNPSRALGLSIS
ncbi:MAG: amidohydrolase family protein [Conexivisphaera sp.]|jgi:aminocarboxymuconate-semialdehyde decarboxylase|nr:amidohydrolase family protein [Conexivisphaerales archaeon]